MSLYIVKDGVSVICLPSRELLSKYSVLWSGEILMLVEKSKSGWHRVLTSRGLVFVPKSDFDHRVEKIK